MSRTYRLAAYLCVFASGMSGLVFQVTWQRYLSFLLGSEARSVSLVVGVFLLGLAAGYRHWGRVTQAGGDRKSWLRVYGACEVAIGLYALVFPWYFSLLRTAAFAAPDLFALDFVFTAALLFVPTFLMGSTIPLLTCALPDSSREVNTCHARIYGINTLGACLGTWLAGFWLVPRLGLRTSLALGAAVNVAVGLFFLLNRARGKGVSSSEQIQIMNRFSTRALYVMAFSAGAVSICLEVLFVRILSLNVGAGYYVFPIVLGVFILGLALGSLSLRAARARATDVLVETLRAGCWLSLVYVSIPYWPGWINWMRSEAGDDPGSYRRYLIALTAFCAAALLPALVSLGRLLPLCYGLIAKNEKDFGRVCGRLYFVNTAGTVAGSCVLGYLALYVLNLDQAYRLALAGLGGPAIWLLVQHAKPTQWRRRGLAALAVVLAVAVVAAPDWRRDSYVVGMFRKRTNEAVASKDLFRIPIRVHRDDVEFYKDGPDATVSVPRFWALPGEPGPRVSRSLVVNGKSDGNTVGDFATMALVGTLPYLSLAKPSGIRAAVVGLGTGITAGVLGKMQDIEEVEVAEISSTVIRAGRFFERDNFGVQANPKIKLVEADAFRYFARGARMFDLIVAEPSNPWVVGVENLYTPQFYELARRRLAEGGVYVQWFHLYEMSHDVLSAILKNLSDAFPVANAFYVGPSDVAVLASEIPMSAPHIQRRFRETFVRTAHLRSGIDDLSELFLIHLFDQRFMKARAAADRQPLHELERPWIAVRANRARFYDTMVTTEELIDDSSDRSFFSAPGKGAAIARVLARHPKLLPQCLEPRLAISGLCRRYGNVVKDMERFREPTRDGGWHRLLAYSNLRRNGFVDRDPAFLEGLRGELLKETGAGGREMRKETATFLMTELVRDGLAAEAARSRELFRRAGLN